MSSTYTNLPTKKPDLAGAAGKAWRLTWAQKHEPNSQVGEGWLLSCPGSNIFWWWYVAYIIHLREEPGLPNAFKQFPGATHELMVISLNPEEPLPDVDATRVQDVRMLRPIDQVHHAELNSDEEAEQLLDLCVEGCVNGVLVPDQDYRRAWSVAVLTTAEHIRTGGHGT